MIKNLKPVNEVWEQKHRPKHKVGDTIYYNSFGDVKSMVVADVVTDGTDNPMYEDENGDSVFEEDLIEYNTAWSENDETNLDKTIWYIEKGGKLIFAKTDELVSWLISLKDRVQPQPKQEWSEEDEAKLKSVCALIRNTKLNGNEGIVNSTIEWLKLFKQRYTWKPSDGQMNGFKQAYDWYNTHCAQSLALNSLYNDLKKLKGE